MILLTHPTGNSNVRGVLQALDHAGQLASFHTSLGVSDQEPVPWWHLPFKGRSFPIPREKLKLRPLRECIRLAASKLDCQRLTAHETGWASIDSVYRDLDHALSRRLRQKDGQLRGVYCYEDGALETFLAARELGLRRIYDLPIAYWETAQRLLQEESARLPEWVPTLCGVKDSAAKLGRKTQEMELADQVICPSQFVVSSIPEPFRRCKQITVTPFGSPPCSPAKTAADFPADRKLRVLFAGSLSQRKGLADLFAAMKRLHRPDIELVVMGAPQVPMEFYRQQYPDFTYEPGRPHAQVLELMRTCDVFCLPSIFEGRALVLQEAMSQGLPLIITPNTGGEDLIDEGVTGFMIPIRQPDQIAARLAWFADHRSEIPELSRAAQVKAGRYTWEAYGQAILKAVL